MNDKSLTALMLLACLLAPAAFAQDTDDSETEAAAAELGWGDLFAEVQLWVAIPTGLQYRPATFFKPDNPLNTELLEIPSRTETSGRYRVGYELNGNGGSFYLTWFSQFYEAGLSEFAPGEFVYGALAVSPDFAGFNDDGLADAFISNTATKMRDMTISYHREVLEHRRVKASWYVQARKVAHERNLWALYFALVPQLPPNFGVALQPNPDQAWIHSQYDGRGVGGGFDVQIPITRRKLMIEAGIGMAVLRGKLTSRYQSQTWAYVDSQTGLLRFPPFTSGDVGSVTQVVNPVGIRTSNDGQSGQVLESYLGLRWKAWKGMELGAGFRNHRYDDVGADLTRRGSGFPANTEVLQETPRSANYEGLYLTLAYRY